MEKCRVCKENPGTEKHTLPAGAVIRVCKPCLNGVKEDALKYIKEVMNQDSQYSLGAE